MPSPVDALRRWFGLLFLALAGGMLVWGQTILKPHLTGTTFLAYWFVCFLLTVAAIITALLDMRAVRKRNRAEQRALIEQALRPPGDAKPDPEHGELGPKPPRRSA